MKETIKYYYNIDVDEIEELDGKYHFKYMQKDYFFVYYNRMPEELDDIITCSRNMLEKNIDCHAIILNRNGAVLTPVGEFKYILLAVTNLEEEYGIIEMTEMSKKLVLNDVSGSIYRNNWSKLWSDKIDYFEYQIRELGIKKVSLADTFSYYIGLAENAISYVTNTNKTLQRTTLDRIVLSHRRIFYPNIKLNYLNPLSFVFDLEVRDIAEYLKALFFSNDNEFVMLELETFLKTTRLSIYGYQMLYARLLYPSYYFDVYEKIMNNDLSSEELVNIVKKADDYEDFLKKAYYLIYSYAPIEKVDWLISQSE